MTNTMTGKPSSLNCGPEIQQIKLNNKWTKQVKNSNWQEAHQLATYIQSATKIGFYQTSWWRLNYHRQRFWKLTRFRGENRGIVGCCWFIGECRGALPWLEIWWHEFVNKLVEWEAFLYPVWIECTQLKDEILFETFAAFCVPVV